MGLEFITSTKKGAMVVTTADFSESAKAFMKTLDPEKQLKLIKKTAQRSYSQAKKNQQNALKSSGIKRVTGTLRRSFKVISSYGETYASSVFVWVGIPRGKKDTLRPYWGANPSHVNGYPKKYSKVGVKKYSKSFASMYGIMLDGGTQYEDGRQRIKPHNFIIKADQGERVTRRMLDNFNKAFEDMQNGKTQS